MYRNISELSFVDTSDLRARIEKVKKSIENRYSAREGFIEDIAAELDMIETNIKKMARLLKIFSEYYKNVRDEHELRVRELVSKFTGNHNYTMQFDITCPNDLIDAVLHPTHIYFTYILEALIEIDSIEVTNCADDFINAAICLQYHKISIAGTTRLMNWGHKLNRKRVFFGVDLKKNLENLARVDLHNLREVLIEMYML